MSLTGFSFLRWDVDRRSSVHEAADCLRIPRCLSLHHRRHNLRHSLHPHHLEPATMSPHNGGKENEQ
jgi:hypothetical protein